MKVLLVFATNSGGTQLASQIIAETLTKNNHQVTVKEVREVSPADFAAADLIILASPSWDYESLEGQPHPDYRPFMEGIKDQKFAAKKFAVVGLGDSSYTYFCGAVNVLEDFIKNIGGTLLVDSIKIDGFYLDQATNSQKLDMWTQNLAKKIS